MPEDLKKTVLELGSNMIKLAGKGEDLEENKQKMLEAVNCGAAFKKFKEMVQNQGGDISYLDDTNKFKKAQYEINVISLKTGTINEINAKDIGELACNLGAGRIKKEDEIDNSVGIVLNKKVGNKVKENDLLATIYANDLQKAKIAEKEIQKIFKIV